MSVTLSDMQFAGAKAAQKWYSEDSEYNNTFVLTGYAGSGKSTCVAAVVEKIGLGPEEVMYMAPTGKAAKVLTRKLKDSGWPSTATTIHKAIYMPRKDKADAIDAEITRLVSHKLWMDSKGDTGASRWDPIIQGYDGKQIESKIQKLTLELS